MDSSEKPAKTDFISIVIPAYNAAATLGSVIDRIAADTWPCIKKIWIVNDGSRDSTLQVATELSVRFVKISVVSFDKNRGYGAAVREGLKHCKEDGCEIAICLHSDGQYPPESIRDFCVVMQNKLFDILQGSRIASGTALSGGMPLYKFMANQVLTLLAYFVFRIRLSDFFSGFLVYSSRALHTIPFDLLSDSFDFDLEVIASAHRGNLKIGELPIPTRYAGEKSYLNPITYGFRVLRVLLSYVLGGYRP